MFEFSAKLLVGLTVQSSKLNDIPHITEHESFVVAMTDELKPGPGSAKSISYQNEKACLMTMINFGSTVPPIVIFQATRKVIGDQKTERNASREFKNTASI
jgi:hypothetical protein